MTQINDFSALGLTEHMLEAIRAKGFEAPTSIQALTIPTLLNQSNDIIAQSQTGTGKTAAYGLPIMQQLEPMRSTAQAIVLVPTRELALQVTEELISFNSQKRLSIAAIYGGASMSEQLRRLTKGIDIVVGTPGRVLDHIRRGTLDLSAVKFLILDEADEMLNMGFIEDVEEIMSHTPEERRVMLFSATMPERIVRLSKTYMRDTEVLKVDSKQITADLTDQIYFEVREADKFDALTRIIDIHPDFYGIVFSRTKVGVDELVVKLTERGYDVEGLHGDVSQSQREQILRKFKTRKANILIATDVAARGIDVSNLSHVINYSLPQDTESYIHRIGRTGRAGNQGTAITFISPSEFRRFNFLRKDIKADIKKETLPSPQDIVTMKRNKIKEDLQVIIEGEGYSDYMEMAEEILMSYNPETALGALLKLAFRNELDEANYPEIRSFTVDRKGTARIFIAVGSIDGYDPRKLVTLLKRECGLRDSSINDIKIMENYSFVTVPFMEAEHVIRKLNNIRKGNRPLAEMATDKRGGESGGRRRNDSGEPRSGRGRRAKEVDNTEEGLPTRRKSARSTEAEGRSDGRRSKRGDSQNEGTERRRVAEEGKKSAKSAKNAKRDDVVKNTPRTEAVMNNDDFDWSLFESGDNSWGEERSAPKFRKRR